MELIKQDDETLLAYRKDGELPFAKVYPPELRHTKTWGIMYRDQSNGTDPFPRFNTSKPNREGVIYELNHAVKHGSDFQLGLAQT